jgi:AcrR family transcriptional regulator
METDNTMTVSNVSGGSEHNGGKERILQLALTRFMEAGFARTSVDDLMSELAMSKKTFYKYFPSKEELVRQIATRIMGEVSRTLRSVVDEPVPFVEKLHRLMELLGVQFRRVGKPMLVDLQRHFPSLWEEIERFRRDHIMRNLTAVLDAGRRSGEVRADVDTRIFLLCYIAAIEGVLTPSVLINESFSAEEALRGIMGLFFRGVLTPEARRQLDELQHSR